MAVQSSLNPKFAPKKDVKSRQITIIGGRGRMGKLFRDKFLAVGHKVNVLEQEDWDDADQILHNAELVLISVPIKYTVDVIGRVAKYLSPNTALCDITSIKTQPTEAMLTHHTGPVMGLHPMFGPSIKSFWQQKVVVCPGRNHESFQWLLDFLQNQGAELITCSPEEHDRMMVYIQATQHFYRLSLGVFLAQTNIDLESSLSISSPSFRQEIEILQRLFCQNPNLCVDIMLATEERCKAINSLANTYSRLAKLVEQKDRDALIQELENTQEFFKKQI
ncbi:MAG: bifunctional chorismate mutase/prephenate dehydrogenase [Nostoc sp. TH1S01]|nr:bifunctional chorismate mutase/prephenate dehydrogenase [Nostoc sp. TH1S01]